MQIQKILLLSTGISIAILASILSIQWQISQPSSIAQAVEQVSSSDSTTIKVVGESSRRVEPDQVTIRINVQTQPVDFQSAMNKHQEAVKKTVDVVTTAVGEDGNFSIRYGPTSFYPYYTGSSADSSLISAYARVHITTDIDHFKQISGQIAQERFRIENLYVSAVRTEEAEKANPVVIIVNGASDASNQEFYRPSALTVQSDTTVVWINKDAAAHTVTSGTPGSASFGTVFDSGFPLMKPGGRFEHRFDIEGVYPYFCQVHPWMTATVLVTSDADGKSAEKSPFDYKVSMDIVTETQPDTLENAIKEYEQQFTRLTKILEGIGIPSDQFSQVSVNFNPVYYGPGQFSLYNANSQINITTDIEHIDSIAKAAQRAGAYIESIFLTVSDSAIDGARKELNQEALENAKSRAMEIIQPLGLEIKGIKRIEVNAAPVNTYQSVIPYRGVNIYPYFDPSFQGSGDISVSLTVEFEVMK